MHVDARRAQQADTHTNTRQDARAAGTAWGVAPGVGGPCLAGGGAGFRRLIAGVAVMLIGAVGVDFLANFVEFGSPPAIGLIYIEESLEMIGGTLVLWGGYLLSVGATGWLPPP